MKEGLYGVVGGGYELSGGCHPAGEVGFERRLVEIASSFRLAGDLDHDLSTAILLRKENCHAFKQALHTRFPNGATVGLEWAQLCSVWTVDSSIGLGTETY